MENNEIIGIIPARYGSTRFPGKPLADIGGKTMIQRVYEQAASILKVVYVATDDERIEKVVNAFGGKVIMTSVEHKSGTDRCAEALDNICKAEDTSFRVVINIQGDEPFISPKQIEQIANCFNNPSTELATLIKPVSHSEDLFDPNKPKVVINKNSDALYFSRSPIPYLRGENQEIWHLERTYYNHIGLYGYRSDILKKITQLPPSDLELSESLEQLRWLENGFSIKTDTTLEESIAIDTPRDLEKLIKSGKIK